MLKAREIEILANNPLFKDIKRQDIEEILGCLMIRTEKYSKHSYIVDRTVLITDVGILLEGSANILWDDYWGKRNIIAKLQKGDMFGETFACLGNSSPLFDVIAVTDCKVLYINFQKIVTSCHRACDFHTQLIKNMLSIVANKNVILASKIHHLTQKNTREKLLSYLSSEARRQGSDTVIIPFNRQELADYLSIERTAMSAVLSKLQKEGLIKYHKECFTLLKKLEI